MTSTVRRVPAALGALVIALATLVSASDTAALTRRERLERAEDRLLELEKDFELVVERYNATREELIGIQAEMARTRLVVEAIQDRMDERQGDAIALARELYMGGTSAAALEAIFSSRSVAELETTIEYLRASETANREVFERLEVDRAELNRHLAELEEDRARALAVEERLSELRIEIEAKVASQEDEIGELNAEIQAAVARRERRLARLAAAAAGNDAPVVPQSVPPNPAPAPNAKAQVAVDAALSQLGKPYQWGAAGPDAYDCSGLTMWAWAQAGVSLPHNSGMQMASITPVARNELQPGDLVFFGSPVHHVGMYIGNNQMVEAPYSGEYVRVVPEDRDDFAGAGRPGV